MKKRYTLTLDPDIVEEVRREISRRSLSDFVEQLLEFWVLNSGTWCARDDGILKKGGAGAVLSKNQKK
jgi:hypothetical protein